MPVQNNVFLNFWGSGIHPKSAESCPRLENVVRHYRDLTAEPYSVRHLATHQIQGWPADLKWLCGRVAVGSHPLLEPMGSKIRCDPTATLPQSHFRSADQTWTNGWQGAPPCSIHIPHVCHPYSIPIPYRFTRNRYTETL